MTHPTDHPFRSHEHRQQAQEHAIARALGTDPVPAWFGEHLDAGCPTCVEQFERAERVVTALHEAPAPVQPAPSVRERLLQRVRAEARQERAVATPAADRVQVWRRWAATDVRGLHTQPAQDAVWEPTSVDGIEVRALHVDETKDLVTMLVRMAAGTAYPPHRHAGGEQCYVLSGDLRVGDAVLRAGDFQLAAQGSEHGFQSTENGCTLLIISSRHDELLAT